MYYLKKIVASGLLLFPLSKAISQEFLDKTLVQGNIYSEASYYLTDTLIGAEKVKEYVRANIYGNLTYRYRGISAGMRYEAYQPPLVGFDPRNEGMGIAHRYLTYTDSLFEVTLGNFYEQFGSGLVFRAYEDKNLGIDNAIDGFRAVARPLSGLTVKAFIGKQRYFWNHGPGTVRGADAEWNLLQLLKPESMTHIIVGGSALSRFQPDKDPIYNLPENVAAFAGRASMVHGDFQLLGEYAYKINDPSATNNLMYRSGRALVATASFSQKGYGVLLTGKWVENMDFRSSRNAVGNDLPLSYIPSTLLQQTYSLGGMYPYSTQPLGEASLFAQVNYKISKNNLLGGKYGTNIQLSTSIANAIDKQKWHDTIAIGTPGTMGYRVKFLSIGNEKYFQDLSLEAHRKVNSNLKATFGVSHQFYNISVLQGHTNEESVKAWIAYLDLSYRFLETQNLRIESQHLRTRQDRGSWAMMLAEYTVAPRWSFTVSDQYNYGNPESAKRKHYFLGNVSYNKGANRVSVRFGKQSQGVVCIGGVCRLVPASYAASVVLSTSF